MHPETSLVTKELSVDSILLSLIVRVVDSADTSGLSSVLFCNPNNKKQKHLSHYLNKNVLNGNK